MVRGLKDIEVQSLIVHILDAKSTTGLVKSFQPVFITPNDRVAQYFARHITNSLADGRAVAARFESLEAGDISLSCGGLMEGTRKLVDGSHEMADRLYAIMARDRRIASGDLAVCIFRSNQTAHVPAYLALLKLDPSFALWHKTEHDADGRAYVTFEVADNVLPTVTERLQKCAFVQPLSPRSSFDLLVLDDQVGERPGESVARFFMHEFLHARPLLDAEMATDALIVAFRLAQKAVRKLLNEEQRGDVELISRAALRRERVDLDDLVANLRVPEEAKTKFDEVLRAEVPERVIEIDARVVNAHLPKRKFRGSGGLKVEIPADLYTSMFRGAVERRDEQGQRYFDVTLRTETWEEVTTS